ncbi:hypothetical protein V3C99_005030 [Haemonchus contortus]
MSHFDGQDYSVFISEVEIPRFFFGIC